MAISQATGLGDVARAEARIRRTIPPEALRAKEMALTTIARHFMDQYPDGGVKIVDNVDAYVRTTIGRFDASHLGVTGTASGEGGTRSYHQQEAWKALLAFHLMLGEGVSPRTA